VLQETSAAEARPLDGLSAPMDFTSRTSARSRYRSRHQKKSRRSRRSPPKSSLRSRRSSKISLRSSNMSRRSRAISAGLAPLRRSRRSSNSSLRRSLRSLNRSIRSRRMSRLISPRNLGCHEEFHAKAGLPTASKEPPTRPVRINFFARFILPFLKLLDVQGGSKFTLRRPSGLALRLCL